MSEQCPHIHGMSSCEQCLQEESAKLEQRITELESQLSDARAEIAGLREFREACESLTGSLWPQNETTEALALLLSGVKPPNTPRIA